MIKLSLSQFQWLSDFTQHRRVKVPKVVPTNSLNLRPFVSRVNNPPQPVPASITRCLHSISNLFIGQS